MQWEIRHIRTLVAIAENGTLTDAGLQLGVSQAQVSRTLRALEDAWGVRLVRRLPREAVLTPVGQQVVIRGRHLLRLAESLEAEARGQKRLRLGYAWAAAGRHTAALQRQWRDRVPETALDLVRGTGPLAGLAEGLVDVAVVRTEPVGGHWDAVLVGTERRVAGFASDHPWARRHRLQMADFADQPLIVDTRAGTTTPQLWPEGQRPRQVMDVDSVDAWLDALGAGHGVGVSAEATAHQHRRDGIRYTVITDAPPVGVWLVWHRGEPPQRLSPLREILSGLYSRTALPDSEHPSATSASERRQV
ncbi:LysR family transcriptional regulator [Nesterenkonia flava]|uniref:LysR family transcriptional regulator n=1 Tax=Nesterenkonia flava TaxID=469799 RepID=A0ABU1FUQ4_9MICC|nr:LysR family transcriptional regulator [Nesterenkonia flava]MDR5712082.1 LysR family transcriptional regulator [Nesterenkonia flava]